MEQVRVEGEVSPVSEAEADAYWRGRHPGSQLGAWASDQSEPLESREALEARVAECAERFGDGPIPRPAALVGVPGGAGADRVLALAPQSPARTDLLLARGRRMARLVAPPVSLAGGNAVR